MSWSEWRWMCGFCPSDEDPHFVDGLEELANVDVFLESMEANLPIPSTHLTILTAGVPLGQLLMGEVRPSGQRTVRHWQAPDGSLSLLEAPAGDLEVPGASPEAELLAEISLLAPEGINLLLYGLPFGKVSEKQLKELIFLSQYLLGNEILLNLYIVVTESPSVEEGWANSFAEWEPGFRHLLALAGKNPSRFIALPKASSRQEHRRRLLTASRHHPTHLLPAFFTASMREASKLVQVEREQLLEKEDEVGRLQLELRRRNEKDPMGLKGGPAVFHVEEVKVVDPQALETRELCRCLDKARGQAKDLKALLQRRLAEVWKSGFRQQVEDLAVEARRRFALDLESGQISTGAIVKPLGPKYFNAFGSKENREEHYSLEGFLAMSARLAMTNSEERLPSLIFDWDDTLCPTSCLRQGGAEAMKLELHAGRIEQVLRAARSFGHVDIVTLANRQWLEQSMHQLGDLSEVLEELEIEVHYAYPEKLKAADAAEGVAAKKAAMSAILHKYYGDSVKAQVHTISFGDQEVEAAALQQVLKEAWSKTWQRPVCKVVRLKLEPSLEDLGQSLQKILTYLPALVRVDADLDLRLETLDLHRW